MKRSILFLLIGLLIGALVSIYFLGSARLRALPGIPLKPPEQGSDNSGSVSVSIDEKFFDALLGTIFQKLGPPLGGAHPAPGRSRSLLGSRHVRYYYRRVTYR